MKIKIIVFHFPFVKPISKQKRGQGARRAEKGAAKQIPREVPAAGETRIKQRRAENREQNAAYGQIKITDPRNHGGGR